MKQRHRALWLAPGAEVFSRSDAGGPHRRPDHVAAKRADPTNRQPSTHSYWGVRSIARDDELAHLGFAQPGKLPVGDVGCHDHVATDGQHLGGPETGYVQSILVAGRLTLRCAGRSEGSPKRRTGRRCLLALRCTARGRDRRSPERSWWPAHRALGSFRADAAGHLRLGRPDKRDRI